MPNVRTAQPEDDIFGHVGGIVRNPFQAASDKQQVDGRLRRGGILGDAAQQNALGAMVHLIDLIVHRQHAVSEFRIAAGERLKRTPKHGDRELRHAGNVHRERARLPFGQFLGEQCDSHGLIADPLQIGIDLDGGQDEAQVAGHRLFHCQQVERHLVDFALRYVDERFIAANLGACCPTRRRTERPGRTAGFARLDLPSPAAGREVFRVFGGKKYESS